ncbi:MAG: DNA repair protein RecN [Ghiorsea sp.]|nr:DNA repair protein RecN [Ghiorsea sp.]
MIVSLQVRQFALFENIQLELQQGMTVFTGETGAGKSILVDALGAVFGARATTDWVRHGAKKAEIIVEIESTDPRLIRLLTEQDIDVDDGIHIRRVITTEGRSRAWINSTPTSAATLKKIGNICFDLHGQHEHQTLMQPEFQQQIIDARVKSAVKGAVVQAFTALQHIRQQLQKLHGNRNEAIQKEAWMREESERILALNIEIGLEDKLETECEAGRHIEQVQLAAANAANLLDEQEVNLRGILGEIIRQVNTVAEHHPALKDAHDLLNQMDALASEVPIYLQDVLDSSMDTEALIAVNERLAQLRAAKRRHDTDEAGLIGLLEHWQEVLTTLDTTAWDEEALQAQLQTCEQDYKQVAQTLHDARIKASILLIQNLRPFLDQLSLKNMQLQASIVAQADKQTWKSDGWDEISLLAAANIGEPFKSLADTASGGELSRLVLALKGCGALENEPDTAIFDEVDVGIGGETGWCVGKLLRNMGSERQVFVVSHLPQVAACAHHQVAISKRVENNRTHTTLIPLDMKARQQEIARMLGGVNAESLNHAQIMFNQGQT